MSDTLVALYSLKIWGFRANTDDLRVEGIAYVFRDCLCSDRPCYTLCAIVPILLFTLPSGGEMPDLQNKCQIESFI